MLGHKFYHATIRKMTALVGTLFNDITIDRLNEDGSIAQEIAVPLYYGPREKYLARVEGSPDLNQKTAVTLPAISFELRGVRYDSNRTLHTMGTIRFGLPDGKPTKTYNPVPYDLDYEVTIYANNEDDALKIVEQIFPYFRPQWNVTVKMLDGAPELKTDVYVNIGPIDYQDLYEDGFERRRAVTWRIPLTVKTYFYGPVPEAKVIKIAITNMYASLTANTPSVTTYIRPGMTANNEPTTDINETVTIDQIEKYDPWDYIVITEENI